MSAIPQNLPRLSGQTYWLPACPEFLLEAFSRIQIRGHEITPAHVIEARRSANFILSDYDNRGINLWTVSTDPDICIALEPAVAEYVLPIDTVDLLDAYLRTFTPSGTYVDVGNALSPITDFSGNPILSSPWGSVTTAAPASMTLSAVAGSQYVTLNWPNHGVPPMWPVFLGCQVAVGGIVFSNFVAASAVTPNTISILAPYPALFTETNQGATPLLVVTKNSETVTVYLPNHNLSIGDPWNPGSISTTLGGITIAAGTAYTVTGIILNEVQGYPSPGFTISAGVEATSNAQEFINGGQLLLGQQASGTFPTDIYLWPISRNDYASLPLKNAPGNPTSLWFSRTNPPKLVTWPVAPNYEQNAIYSGPYLGLMAYRTRDPQLFNPGAGTGPDVPRRFYESFVAELCARMAEKYKPEQFSAKAQLAMIAWQRAADMDREKTTLHLIPEMSSLFS